jgi:hypothetical protein
MSKVVGVLQSSTNVVKTYYVPRPPEGIPANVIRINRAFDLVVSMTEQV